MASEYHISSLVVQVLPQAQPTVRTALSTLDGVEVHADTPVHKLVVTLECRDRQTTQARVDAIRAIQGVVSTVLVYQQVEPLTEEEWI
ncbi:chaperone NapD [Marinobacter hydrocarbonoclasticus]|nr:chaperone NapD [Marinobacter nauticus]